MGKQRVERTRNNGTFTEAAFWNWLRTSLRRMSMTWKPIAQVRKEAKIPYKGPNKRRKFSFVCAKCNGEFGDKEVDVHHILECGTLKSFNDLAIFAERLFVEKEGLVVLCKQCHTEHHKLNKK